MNELIARFNNLLVVNQNLFSKCCCNITSGYVYWEAVPCQAYTTVGEYCEDIDQCRFDERKYVNALSVCESGETRVCECQKLVIPNFTSLTQDETGQELQGATWEITANFSQASGIFTSSSFNTSVRHTASNIVYNRTFNYSNYTYLHQLVSDINSYAPNGSPFVFTLARLSASGVPDSFADATYSSSLPDTLDILTRPNSIFLEYSGSVTAPIFISNNFDVVSEAIENALTAIIGPSTMSVEPDIDNEFNTDALFYITFIGGSLCGFAQSLLEVSHRLVGASTQPSDPYISDGTYQSNESWGTHSAYQYSLVPSGAVPCPFDNASDEYTVPNMDLGYVSPQCCPQKGALLGKLQHIQGATSYGSDFENLENTIYLNDGCYKLPPYFFLFGKTGRLYDNPEHPRTIFHLPHCNYASGECENDVPCNCVPELFTTSFHKNTPWGPFGSYYSGIEDTFHAAYLTDPFMANYMAANAYQGYRYAPSGTVRTVGTWTETTGIILRFNFAKHIPYYIGTEDPNFIDRIPGTIDVSTLTTGLIVASGNTGVGDTILAYNTSGKNVLDFITAINNIEIESTGIGNCKLFAFCPASSDDVLTSIPLTKLNNLSVELFDSWALFLADDESYQLSNPQNDTYGYSSSTIFASVKKYPDMFVEDNALPNNYNSDFVTQNAFTPPPCRKTHNLPKADSFDGGELTVTERNSPRPFWTTMQGCEETILRITKYPDPHFDPLMRSVEAFASGRVLYVVVSSGSTILASTGLNTAVNSGYTHTAFAETINNLRLPRFGVAASSYRPLFAASGDVNDYHVYVDDRTWWDGAIPTDEGVGVPTPTNWGFVEPIFNTPKLDLNLGGTLDINTWVRRRCNWTIDEHTTHNDPQLNPCVPPDSPRLEPSIGLECNADDVVSGIWLVTYGCQSSVCKDEYYIRAERCGCNTMYRCSEDGSSPIVVTHPFNRVSSSEDCSQLSTPTLYMCASNIHPDCDIPFLIKVPYQFICNQEDSSDCYFGTNCDLMEFCGDPRCPPHDDISESPIKIGYGLPDWSCVHNDATYSYMNNGYQGWCQYIDPEALTIVTKGQIPRTYPPTALVMERTARPFCTTYINALDLGNGDTKYDSLRPLWPWVPPEYIVGSDGNHPGWPCFLDHLSSNSLFAYVRPMVSALNGSDICTDKTCGRSDIDCNTRCCGCGFICQNGGDPCDHAEIGPVRNVRRQETVSYEYTRVGNPISCCNILLSGDCGIPGNCNIGGNGCNTSFNGFRVCLDGTENIVTTVDFDRFISESYRQGFTEIDGVCFEVTASLGCCWGPGGTRETQTTYGGCGGTNYFPCCGSNPSCYCGTNYGDCVQTVTENLPCDCPAGISAGPESCALGVGYYVTELAPGTTRIISTACQGCISGTFGETETVNTYNSTLNDCAAGTITYSQNVSNILEGDSTVTDDTCGVSGSIALGIGLTSFAFVYDGNTCANWTSDADGEWLYRGTWTEGFEGTVTYSDLLSDGCNFNAGVNPKTYEYINDFSPRWQCGLPSYETASATGTLY
jgi:hypothetical protein